MCIIIIHVYMYMYIHLQIALVKWTESVGLTLVDRGLVSMTTEGPGGEQSHYEILQLFPFTSERKRMGIVVRVSRDTCIRKIVYFPKPERLFYQYCGVM